MTTYTRKNLSTLWQDLDEGKTSGVYLIVGERFLGRQTAATLIDHLLPGTEAGRLIKVDGEREDPLKTLNALRTYSLFEGRQVVRVTDSRLFHSRNVAKNIWKRLMELREKKDLTGAARALKEFLEIGGTSPGDLAELSAAAWKARFAFNKPAGGLAWTADLLAASPPGSSGKVSKKSPKKGSGPDDLYLDALKEGLPRQKILVMLAETADKRKRLYKYLAGQQTVIDLSVDQGFHRAATDAQREVVRGIVRDKLHEMSAQIQPRALDLLLDRVGFHPVAAALESEKLALLADEGKPITVEDLEAVAGRTSEEAIFKLTETYALRNLQGALGITGRLIDRGTYPLVIIAALRNYLKKLLVVRSAQELDSPRYNPNDSFATFKKSYLERLKQEMDPWPAEFSGHPYALYMLFKNASIFTCRKLIGDLTSLLEADYQLKGSGLPPRIVLDQLFFKLFSIEKGSKQSAGINRTV